MLDKQAKIMVVDDMNIVRKSIKGYLISLGYENIIEAEKGDIALDKYEQSKPDFIFMNIVMPGVTGDEALKTIRAKDKDIPIVILSSVADTSVIEKCEQQGILGYVLKPLTAENGPKQIKGMLDKV